VIKDCPYLDL